MICENKLNMLEAAQNVNSILISGFFVTKIIIQVYEIQTPSEAEEMIALGVDHIGSVLVSQDDWKLQAVRETIQMSAGTGVKSSLIALFNDLNAIFRVLDYYAPDIVHFCEVLTQQDNAPSTCEDLIALQENIKIKFPHIKIMRSVPIAPPGTANLEATLGWGRLFEPVSDYFLTDTLLIEESGISVDRQPVTGYIGITGRTCDWNIAAKLVESSNIPVILAGGLAPDNVYDGILQVLPDGVDSCTGTNAVNSIGDSVRFKKDFAKVKRFVDETRRAEKTIGKLKLS